MITRLYKIMSVAAAACMLSSCIDTIILPDDKTVDQDFWQTKADVASMVNSAYAAMASNDNIARFIVWGDFRSDEMVLSTSPSGGTYDALEEMAAVNMQTTNQFAAWSTIYDVINRCNIVLERAEEVMSIDPNYTLGDYQTDRSQMLALRALCYFYLVRNYRDVPYVTEAYMNSSQNMQIPQSAPLEVINNCIADLEEAAKTPISSRGFNTSEWQRVGWITNDGVNAILADVYLWRASVTHSQADYAACVACCDKVIASKKAQHVRGRNEVVEKVYPLADYNTAYSDLFVSQNAEESIYELQSKSNTAVCQYLFKYASNTSSEGYFKATTIFGNAASKVASVSAAQVFSNNDLRYFASCYDVPGDGELNIRKMISNSGVTSKTAQSRTSDNSINYGGMNRNYIIYRLSDVMLMKAEALVQQVDTTLAAADQQALLLEPFQLVQAVNNRSLHPDNMADSMTWAGYRNYSKDQMEQLVMQERLRELCFEGKRWYDLLRYNYRHIDYDANRYNQKLNDMSENNSLATISADMKNLMVRGRGTDGIAVSAKMQNEAYLYLPVPNSDIIVCPLLNQNPAYKDAQEYQKNY